MSEEAEKPRFWNYPPPKEGPDAPCQDDAPPNPILRGYPLAIAVWIIASSSFVSGILWKNAKFDKLKDIEELDEYEPRHDPTVIPIAPPSDSKAASIVELPPPKPRANAQQHYTSADYVSHYKTGKLTPSDVAEALIPLISKDPEGEHSIAFLESKAELVREAAKASTRRYQEGRSLGPLDGVPVAVKDEVDLKGYKRTLGSTMDFTNQDDETAWCVKQWEEAGAIVIGKTNMHEIGLDTTNNNPNTGTPLNPHNPRHYTGGSSGGSAYAVSTGLVPIALGADGGGSIRIPSSLCGIYGLKPSHGRVSGRPTHDLGVSVGVYGPMAASIDDLRLAYRIMAKPDKEHGASGMFPDPLLPSSLSPAQNVNRNGNETETGKRKYLGICAPWLSRADAPVRALIDRAIEYYTTQKHYRAIPIPLPFLPESQKSHALTILSEIGSHFPSSPPSSSHPSGSHTITNLTYPNQLLLTITRRHASAQDFLAAQKLRSMMLSHLSHLFTKYPGMVIVSPTMPRCGSRIKDLNADIGPRSWGVSDGDASLRSIEAVFLANWSGCPAVVAPVGYADDDDGGGDGSRRREGAIPVGIMGMGEWGSEEALMDWVEEGMGFLWEGNEERRGGGGGGGGGVRRPMGREGAWVDVLARAVPSA